MLLSIPLVAALSPHFVDDKSWTQERLEATSAEIQVQVEDLRGAKFLRPVQVKMSDTAALRKYIQEREAEMLTPARRHRDDCTAKLLGIVAPGVDLHAIEMEVVESQIGGFYDPKSDTFFLMDAMKGAVARVILAHELTHALDDQLYDLDAVIKTANDDTDAELAIRAVIEGSGTNTMNRWTVAHMAEIPPEEMAAVQAMGAAELAQAPPIVWKPLMASYFAGDGFLSRGGGMNMTLKPATAADVERAFRDPPRSTEQILHPDAYWKADKLDAPVRVRFEADSVPAGWTEIAQDTLGELALALVTTAPDDRKGLDISNPMSILGVKFTNKAATGWGGDRLVLLGRGDDRFLQLVTVWDTAKDATEFVEALRQSAPDPFAGPRETTAGWVPKLTPTFFDITGPTDADPKTVVVRSASIVDPADASAGDVKLRWTATVPAEKSAQKSAEKSAEDGR